MVDKPEFTLKLGKHQWTAHAQTLSEHSRHFQVLCNGSFWVGLPFMLAYYHCSSRQKTYD